MHYLMKRNADLKNILRILVLKTESQFWKKLSILVSLSDANVVWSNVVHRGNWFSGSLVKQSSWIRSRQSSWHLTLWLLWDWVSPATFEVSHTKGINDFKTDCCNTFYISVSYYFRKPFQLFNCCFT
jgi:hypothetical protein